MKVFIAGGDPRTEALVVESAYLTPGQVDQLEALQAVYPIGTLEKDLEAIQSCEALVANATEETLETALHTAIAAKQGVFTIALIDDETPEIYTELIDTEVETADELAPAILAVMDAVEAYDQQAKVNKHLGPITIKPRSTYIVGPQRGRPEGNKKAFDDAAAYLTGLGWYALTPFSERPEQPAEGIDFGGALRADMEHLTTMSSICLLDGWQESASSVVAISIAQYLSLPIYEIDPAKKQIGEIEVHQALGITETGGQQ